MTEIHPLAYMAAGRLVTNAGHPALDEEQYEKDQRRQYGDAVWDAALARVRQQIASAHSSLGGHTVTADIPLQAQPAPEQMWEQLQNWFHLQAQLKELKTREILLRKALAGYYFPEPREGANRLDIGWGHELLLTHALTRNVDEAVLDASMAKLRKAKVKLDELITYAPHLSLSEYRNLTEHQRALVDECLVIKEGTPSLAIVPAVVAAPATGAYATAPAPVATAPQPPATVAPAVASAPVGAGVRPWEVPGVSAEPAAPAAPAKNKGGRPRKAKA